MEREPLFFVQEAEGAAPTANVMFTPTGAVGLTSSDGVTEFEEGADFCIDRGSRSVCLPPGSRIPFKTLEQMHPLPGSPQSYVGWRGGDRSLFWSEGHLFHDLQVHATYSHTSPWLGFAPRHLESQLPLTTARLRAHEPVKLLVLGDSISAGGNASGLTGAAPYQEAYPDLTARGLGEHYGAPVTVRNLSVGGTASGWGVTMAGAVAKERPDLVCLAFGMNDASGGEPREAYVRNIASIIEGVSAASPGCEFILVATMTANSEWTYSAPELYPQYRDGLASLCRAGVVLADMTAMWTSILEAKSFADITGNGLNHPNDFGHRVYADVLLALLIP